jgi:hypothetical protein
MRFRRATENNSLIPSIVEAVNFFPDFLCFPVKGEGARGKRLVVPAGTADILGVRRSMLTSQLVNYELGQAFAVECKGTHLWSCGCDSCVAQRAWRIEWEKRGGLYILARSPQEAIDGLMGRRAA